MTQLLATTSADQRFRNVHALGFGSYDAHVRDTLCNAKERVCVITPFIDGHGAKFLQEACDSRSSKTAEWNIYVRNLTDELRNIINDKPWNVFEYVAPPHSLPPYGMHAKIVLADRDVAILGSMNLIRTNMHTNLEVGVQLDTKTEIEKIIRLEYSLQEASKIFK